jgi:alkylation response protein AidB-like acyl-CoA dehydrogenase
MLRGGEWLIASSESSDVFTPERLSDEHRLVAKTVADFVTGEVLPSLDRLEQKDWVLSRDLIRRLGALGLLGVDATEADGGSGADKVTSMLVSENMAGSASFGATFGAQSNLVILPLSLWGTDAQKRRYLPRLMSGEIIGAYCLSEPGSGSDALGAKARAVRHIDGGYLLNGEKTWITNGGIADVYIVFAKVDGEHFTAFIVERAFPGVSSGKEEHKMGLHGSSTTPVILQDVRVPAENVLGEVGKGHKIAFNVLNFARFKLGAMCVGGARRALGEAAKYAAARKQFGQPISSFGAIKHKLAEMLVRTYAIESLTYRTIGLIDARMKASTDLSPGQAALAAFEEYAIEASIAKVAGSEMLDFVLDENIQIHGGNGYVRDYPAERHYRDGRVNRIFEGTNEINRLLIPGMLARRAAKGEPAVIAAAKKLAAELKAGPEVGQVLSDPESIVSRCRKAALLVFSTALDTYGAKLADEQEVLTLTADMMMDVYAAESAVLRAAAASQSGHPQAARQADAARVLTNDAVMRVAMSGRQAMAAMVDTNSLAARLTNLSALLTVAPINTVEIRRRLADDVVARGGYLF